MGATLLQMSKITGMLCQDVPGFSSWSFLAGFLAGVLLLYGSFRVFYALRQQGPDKSDDDIEKGNE